MNEQHLKNQYETLTNQIRVLFLQNINQKEFDWDTLKVMNFLSRELLQVKKMLADFPVQNQDCIKKYTYNAVS
ncbi:MAG: hypothetical protein JXR46_15530 [Calditrichaceae bacterium]|nr:hypothetical protein [Calditrichaceae bacterium]MBN2710455.1 hypothetical protein [Calditrichaceae bacterium]RQV93610.1 MAG: hypothetical protein EH224_12105 [Calditrichota bacterium]